MDAAGTRRVAKAVLIGSVPPAMLKAAASTNTNGTPMETFDQIRQAVLSDGFQFWKDLTVPFYGANGAGVSQGFTRLVLAARHSRQKAVYDCAKAFCETDFTEDVRKSDVLTLTLHGDEDQIVPPSLDWKNLAV